MSRSEGSKLIVENRKARFDYHILDRFEAGMVLSGTEVKSLRAKACNLADSYAQIKNGELFVIGLHISPYEQGNRFNLDPSRTRKLLMHKREIHRLYGQIKQEGLTLVPCKLYFKRGKVKMELGLAKGKKLYDKRQDQMTQSSKRQIERQLKGRRAAE